MMKIITMRMKMKTILKMILMCKTLTGSDLIWSVWTLIFSVQITHINVCICISSLSAHVLKSLQKFDFVFLVYQTTLPNCTEKNWVLQFSTDLEQSCISTNFELKMLILLDKPNYRGLIKDWMMLALHLNQLLCKIPLKVYKASKCMF